MKSHIKVNAIVDSIVFQNKFCCLKIQKIKFNNKRARRHGHFTVFFTFSKKKRLVSF